MGKTPDTEKPKRPVGRPSDYTPELADEICARIAEGRSLHTIAKDDDMPAEGTIYRWLFNHLEFQEKYARAREAQADVLAEEIRDIADTPIIGEKVTIKADGSQEVVQGDTIERSRLRVDARKWLASKLKPKKYGDSTTLKGDKDNPLDALGSVLATKIAEREKQK